MFKLIRLLTRALVPRYIWERIRAAWNRQRIGKVEEICLREMVRASAASAIPQPTGIPALSKGAPLRRILLIADVMWETNELVPELRRICEVGVHDLRPVLRNTHAEQAPEHILRSVESYFAANKSNEPDLVLLYLRGNLLSKELFDVLRLKTSCPIIGMNLDDKVSFWDYGTAGGGDHYQKWAPHFDLNLTNSKIAESWYHQAGAACLYLPPAMKRSEGLAEPRTVDFQHALSFVGSPKVDRETLIRRLKAAGLPVTVFGKGWQNGGWVEDPVAIYRASQINLGLGMATPHFSTTKNRDFECPGVGACYLTTFNWELAEWWDIGKEILCYRNEEELIEIACWYRNRPDLCLTIAKAAWRRGNAEHTWELRFRKLFREIGFAV